MTDRNELRRLAEASLKAEETWHHEADLHGSLACTYGEAGDHYVEQDAAYIAAASPDVVLGMLNSIAVLEGWYATASGQRNAAEAERDQLRAALEAIANHNPAVTHGWAEETRWIARSALKAR